MAVESTEGTKVGNHFSFTVSEKYDVALQISPTIFLVAIIGISLLLMWKLGFFGKVKTLELKSADIRFGKGTLSFEVNNTDFQVAYSIWVELATRKLGIPIDLENDVISEVYDTWYNFFGVTRELVKSVPASKLKSESTKQIVSLSTRVLNEAIRPHLTTWQAKFRR